MTLKDWERNNWLKSHTTSQQEISDLLAIVERDLRDSRETGISADWRFGIAYNAALKLCTVLLCAAGYRPEHLLAHYRTLAALPLVLGDSRKEDADYLETCRRKRNVVEYDRVGGITDDDAVELADFAEQLRIEALSWLRKNHPDLI